MKRLFTTLFLLLTAGFVAHAQTYTMSNSSVTTCSGTFYDSGGASANYGNNENFTMTFTSGNGNRLSFNFSNITMSLGDYIAVYDGPSTAYPFLASYDNTSAITITSTGASLTFVCFSTSSANSSGWAATITCTGPTLPVYNLSSGTVTACSGVFYDNGGAAANYTDGQDITQTFCSGTSDHLQFTFSQFTSNTSLSAGDTLFVYDGNNTAAAPLMILVNGSLFDSFTSSGTCVTFRFKSNASGNSTGWAGEFQCVPSVPANQVINMSTGVRYVCNALFYDNGGNSSNYSNNLNITQTLTSYNGERISVNFSTISMSLGDYIAIYDGPSTAYPFLISYDNASSVTVTSTGSSLTFVCFSTSSANSTGWAATVTCAGPVLPVYNMSNGTVTACSGMFFDNGGAAANYTDGANLVQTFCSGTSDHLQFTFSQYLSNTSLSAGDTLFVYDGNSTAAPPLMTLVSGSLFDGFTTSGSCATFRFKSNASGNTTGWAGQFQCVSSVPANQVINMSTGVRYVCNALFYDNGGVSSNYSNNLNITQTLTSYNGERININFSSMSMSLGDYISVYDGPSTAYPLLGSYNATAPLSLTSSGTSLTILCFSTSSANSTGWAATVTCAGPVLPVYTTTSGVITTCNGVFYDNGGAGANYINNSNQTVTFNSANGQYLKFEFNPLHFNLETGDSLYVYDGNSSAAPLYGIYTGSVAPVSITSSTTSLTFRFVSNSSLNNVGWQAWISCVNAPDNTPQINMVSGVRYTCGGNFYDAAGPNANYFNNENRTMTFYSNSGCGIRFTFSSFNLSLGDVLYVYDGTSTAAPLLIALGGSSLPAPVQSTGNALTFLFTSTSSSNSIGWDAVISCPSQPLATVTANGPLNFCPGDSVVLTATPNSSYLWNTGATTQSITVYNAGTYWVNVSNANNCSAISNLVSVTTNLSITAAASASGATTFCQGGSVTLNATGGNTYTWSNGNTGSSLLVTQSGNYYAIAESGACRDTSSIIAVTVNPLPTVTLTLPQDSFCYNLPTPVPLTGGSPAGGVWSGSGVTAGQFSPSAAGTGIHLINYTFTDSLGCVNTASQTVQVDICLGITEPQVSDVSVYPNPTREMVTITIGNLVTVQTIQVMDLTGRILVSEAVNNRSQIQLSVAHLASGVYILTAGNHSQKLIKE